MTFSAIKFQIKRSAFPQSRGAFRCYFWQLKAFGLCLMRMSSPSQKMISKRSEGPFEQRSYHPSSVHWGWTISVLSPSIYFSLGMHLKDRKYTTSVFIQEKEFPKCFINFLWCFLRGCTHKFSKCHRDDEHWRQAKDAWREILIIDSGGDDDLQSRLYKLKWEILQILCL